MKIREWSVAVPNASEPVKVQAHRCDIKDGCLLFYWETLDTDPNGIQAWRNILCRAFEAQCWDSVECLGEAQS